MNSEERCATLNRGNSSLVSRTHSEIVAFNNIVFTVKTTATFPTGMQFLSPRFCFELWLSVVWREHVYDPKLAQKEISRTVFVVVVELMLNVLRCHLTY